MTGVFDFQSESERRTEELIPNFLNKFDFVILVLMIDKEFDRFRADIKTNAKFLANCEALKTIILLL
jgi:hypothetical protein